MKRRGFIRAIGGAAAFSVLPRRLIAGSGMTPPSETVCVAAIGAYTYIVTHYKYEDDYSYNEDIKQDEKVEATYSGPAVDTSKVIYKNSELFDQVIAFLRGDESGRLNCIYKQFDFSCVKVP